MLARVVGAGLEGGDSVVGVCPSSEGVAGERSRAGKGVAAGCALVRRGGMISGEPADGVVAPVLRTVVRGGPVRGACAVGAAVLGKGLLAWSRSPGLGDIPCRGCGSGCGGRAAQQGEAAQARQAPHGALGSAIHSFIQSIGQSSSPPCRPTKESVAAAAATKSTIATSL